MNNDHNFTQDAGAFGAAAATLPLRAALGQRPARRAFAYLRLGVRTWRRWRQARRNVRQLYALDARTLRDLGLTRSELPSIVAELDGRAELTRRRLDHAAIDALARALRVRNVEASLSLFALSVFTSVLLDAAAAATRL